MRARILVADKLKQGAFDHLVAKGVQVDADPHLEGDALVAAIPGANVLVVRSTKVSKEVVEAGRALSLIVRAGSGVNTIDVEAASAHGIYVANCPGRNSVAVAELAIGLLLSMDRRIPDNVADLRAGRWNKAGFSKAQGIKGRRLGLIGFGAIGKAVATRAIALEMDVLAHSRSLTTDGAKALGVRKADLDQIFSTCHAVSLHLPLNDQTRGLVSRALLTSMKEGAMLINTARAEVVDNEALTELAEAGKIRVGTDVFVGEPEGKAGAFDDRLGMTPNVYGTHHIGASTEQAQDAIASAAVDIVTSYLERGEVTNAVNILHRPEVQGALVVRHLDRVGVLASVLDKLRSADINVATMENRIFAGGRAACAKIEVATRPSDALVGELNSLENVLNVELK